MWSIYTEVNHLCVAMHRHEKVKNNHRLKKKKVPETVSCVHTHTHITTYTSGLKTKLSKVSTPIISEKKPFCSLSLYNCHFSSSSPLVIVVFTSRENLEDAFTYSFQNIAPLCLASCFSWTLRGDAYAKMRSYSFFEVFSLGFLNENTNKYDLCHVYMYPLSSLTHGPICTNILTD